MRYLFISLACITILGCSTPTEYYNPLNFNNNETKKSTPKISHNISKPKPIAPLWFTNGQNNSDNLLYGFGTGDTLDQATNNALADMTQRLQVVVSSTTSFENIINNNNVSQKLIQQVTTHTTKFNIPNYNIINQTKSYDTYYIEIQINKQQTISNLQNIIKSNLNQAIESFTNIKNKSSLYRFDIAQNVNNNIRIIKSSLRTLLILSPNINIEQQMIKLNNIDNELINLKRSIQIYVDKQNSGFFYDSLEKFLKVNNYTIVNNKDLANIYIALKLENYNSSYKDKNYCLDNKIELQVTDKTSGQIYPKQYNVKVCSKQGRSVAIDKATQIFYSQLENTKRVY
ncbi:LPP20 family lipoprotein [Francisella sp. 19X1-34]|uniref:LPP20 family lipoprotein n=1 Tax=Francisella sp. 19X1-34 TaxID=3087177 RepID=UPI002E31B04A|nr:LPP20 family lipoprotein [Francisella sp. 19X1-34]MED7788542.1 LPP20 family lipoprotein [Francisella sp. 19X1-34]